jgi:anti-sigma regulatory factor (Ser/Thr protein kinase)
MTDGNTKVGRNMTVTLDDPPILVDRHGGVTLPSTATAAGLARKIIGNRMTQWGLLALVDDARIVVSELVANAVQHTPGRFLGLALHRSAEGTVTIAVRDASRGLPRLIDATEALDHGRGLSLVDALCQRWGVTVSSTGKTVWADLRAPTRPRTEELPPMSDDDRAWRTSGCGTCDRLTQVRATARSAGDRDRSQSLMNELATHLRISHQTTDLPR